ncbi:MAG: lamin tail domain-containing protein [Gammaproteobacteria bacterium]|nr:lamin tail domain-containing protein [Gammaproteobacteria bacterium]
MKYGCNKLKLLVVAGVALSSTNLVHAAPILPGDLLISEVMANPGAVSDTAGEWFELFNASGGAIDLNGLLLLDDGSDSHVIDNSGPLLIAPGEYFVLGRNGDSSINGGYTADYVYSGFTLGNTDDEIILSDGISELIRLVFTSGSNIGINGISAELSNLAGFPPGQDDYFLTTGFTYGLGDFGTPGGPGNMPLVGPSPVPLPPAVWLFGTGVAMFMGIGRRRKLNSSR